MIIFFRSRSILQLTITGFMAVTLLLVIAVTITIYRLDQFSDNSQQSITKVAGAMQASRKLIGEITAMDRNVRQYMVLGDPGMLDIYKTRREAFIQSANELGSLGIHEEVNSRVNKLFLLEEKAFDQLNQTYPDENAASGYPELLSLAYQTSETINNWIGGQQLQLRQQSEQTQHLLTIQTLLLVCTALVLAGLFTALITRPLRQIDRAIKQLGSGKYDAPIHVDGPLDIQALGVRLDWLRNRLTELEEQKTFFMRHVSHELKTPLTAILEGTALLNEGLVGPLSVRQTEITGILHNNCRRLQDRIESLLRYNLESLSILKPMPYRVELDEIINIVLSDHALTIKSGRYHIINDIEKTPVYGDREQLRIIIDNLIFNAINYSPDEGTIRISLRKENHYAKLEIMDEGPGIPVEERENVFEAFHQGSPPEGKPAVKGTGLGLAITREYVGLNEGSIEIVDSPTGTHIVVRIPLGEKE